MHVCQHRGCLRFHILFGKDVNAFPNFLRSLWAAQHLKFFKSMSAKRQAYEREVQKTKLNLKQALHTDRESQAFGKELNIKQRAQDLLLLKGIAR